MHIATGVDLARIDRVAQLCLNPRFLERVFNPGELQDSRPHHLAGLFAAKEAIFKALGEQPRWHSVTILAKSDGRPVASLDDLPGRQGVCLVDISISHDGNYAVAVALVVWTTERVVPCPSAWK